ncbi:metallophosphoesterase [Labrys sp. 22185]|uniref:metallophosphoesterase n=1 Tax=Labrys sp. 22185 TaxID=3453888 RepID=UPI003F850CA9
MRLWVLSDLHVDNSPYTLAPTPAGADAVVIAGDVCNRLHDRALPWLAQHVLPRGLPLIYVPGNHDFYRENVETELRKARDRARLEGIHLLAEGETLTASGVRFIGATLWTDYAVAGSPFQGQVAAGMQMNDHKLIRTGPNYRRWQTRDALLSHGRHRSAIANTLARPFNGPSVVISHHAPHPPFALAECRQRADRCGLCQRSDLPDCRIPAAPLDTWSHSCQPRLSRA